jgi:glycosyltransferase involved in cell wall biosynthesis
VRVGIVVPGFSAHEQDWCIPALRNYVAALARTDDVRVLALRYPYRRCRYQAFGAQVTALGGGAAAGPYTAALWRAALAALFAEHRRQPFHVLHAFWADETGFLTALAGRALGVRTIVSVAGGELEGFRHLGYGGWLRPAQRVKIRLALRLAGRVTVGSRYLLRMAAARLPWLKGFDGAPRSTGEDSLAGPGWIRRAAVAPLGVDTRLFHAGMGLPPKHLPLAARQSTGEESPPRLLTVGSLIPLKDQALVIRAVQHLRARDVRCYLDVVGSGPTDASLKALAARIGVADAVRFRGDVLHDRLPDLYRAATLYVHASRHEAQGMSILEAASCGLPIVGTAVGVVPELSPQAALAVPVGQSSAFADAVELLLRDRPRLTALGQAAAVRVADEFSLEVCTARFRALYETTGPIAGP